MEPFNLDGFLDDFRTEALEHVRLLDAQLLILEREPTNLQTVRTLFLSAHTIKGGAAMLELDQVRQLAHALEDMLDELRSERRRLDRGIADVLFQAIDRLRELVERSKPGPSEPDPATLRLIDVLRGHPGRPIEPPAIQEAEPRVQAPTILLVEDSATVRLLITNQLRRAGFEVETVGDSGEALALVATRQYNLVIASAKSRGIGGPELAAAIRALPTGRLVPIILMSSDDDPALSQRASEAGADAVVRKGSFRDDDLANRALVLIARRANPRQTRPE